jgi:hypothetical protein
MVEVRTPRIDVNGASVGAKGLTIFVSGADAGGGVVGLTTGLTTGEAR